MSIGCSNQSCCCCCRVESKKLNNKDGTAEAMAGAVSIHGGAV